VSNYATKGSQPFSYATTPDEALHPYRGKVYRVPPRKETRRRSEAGYTVGSDSIDDYTARMQKIKNDELRRARTDAGILEANLKSKRLQRAIDELEKGSPKDNVKEKAEDPLQFLQDAMDAGVIAKPPSPDSVSSREVYLIMSYRAKAMAWNLLMIHIREKRPDVPEVMKLFALMKTHGYFITQEELEADIRNRAAEEEAKRTSDLEKELAREKAENLTHAAPFDEKLLLRDWGAEAANEKPSEPGVPPGPEPRVSEADTRLEEDINILLWKVQWMEKTAHEQYVPKGFVADWIIEFMEKNGKKIGEGNFQFNYEGIQLVLNGDLVRTNP